MSKAIITEALLTAIATAIRNVLGTETTYTPAQMATAISGMYPEPTGSVNITQNGTANVKDYSSATINVPNSYASGDEGKVVSNGALVAQTAHATVTENGTIDTTLNNSVTVNVSGSSPTFITKNITENGTYNASSDNADGYSQVVVNVSGGGGSNSYSRASCSIGTSIVTVEVAAMEVTI